MVTPPIALVTRETRLQGLLDRWGTKGAVRFRLNFAHQHERERRAAPIPIGASDPARQTGPGPGPGTEPANASALAAAEFSAYEQEHLSYHQSLARLRAEIDLGYPIVHVPRLYLSNYDFRSCLAVVVVGQDGLVANTAKYAGDVPIVAVNPDPQRIDGVLLPFQANQVRHALQQLIAGSAKIRQVTLAEVTLNDGQRMLAFNDLFVGCSSHASARYTLMIGNKSEPQSSSGMIISTGAGSTGWLSSMFNMLHGFSQWRGGGCAEPLRLDWSDHRLAWVVREPFLSKQSRASLVAGLLEDGDELVIESLMPAKGVVFSDGIESDFLEFNSGSIARVRRATQSARLVFPNR